MTKTKAKSRILDAVQETVADLRRLSFTDKRTQEKLNELCLNPTSTDNHARVKKAQRAD